MKADENEPTIRLQLDKALDLGEYTKAQSDSPSTLANSPTTESTKTKGTLTFDFDSSVNTQDNSKRRSMSLKLASAKVGDKDVSLKGNLKVIGTTGGSGGESEIKATNNVQFKAELDGGVTGDVILSKTVTSNITFGKSNVSNQNIEIGGRLTIDGAHGGSTYVSKHNISLNGQTNAIKGGISSSGGTLNINFNGTKNTVQGEIRTNYDSTNNINLNGTTNTVTGKIFSWAGTNKIDFNGTTNTITGNVETGNYGTSKITFRGTTNKVKGDVISGYGTSNLTFEKGSNEIIGSIKSWKDENNGTINITFKEGTTDNKITGNISTDWNSTNNINLNGSTNTIVGKVNSWAGTNKITFSGENNQIIGNIRAANYGVSNIVFERGTNEIKGHILSENKNGTGNGTNNVTFKGDKNKISGGVYSGKGGKSNITFTRGENNITGRVAITNNGNSKINIAFNDGTSSNTIDQEVYTGNQGKVEVSMGGSVSNTIKQGLRGESARSTLKVTISGNGTNLIDTYTKTLNGGNNQELKTALGMNGTDNTIKTSMWADYASLTADFKNTSGSNTLNGMVLASRGTNTLTMGVAGNSEVSNTIKGDIFAFSTTNGNQYLGKNLITLNGQTNQIIGKVTTKSQATTEITFNTANGGSSLLKGDILNGESGSAKNGTTNISFKGNNSSMSLNGSLENKSGASTISFSGDNASMRITGEAQNTSASNSNGTMKISFSGNSSSMSIDKDVKTTGGNTEVSFTGNNSTINLGGTLTNQNATTNLSISGNHSQMTIIGAIKSDGGSTHLSIKGDHLNIDVKALEVSNAGKMNVSFTGNNSTLRLRDAQHQISTLTSSSTAARSSMNNMIDLSSNANSVAFTLLEIGTKSTNAVAGGSGAQAGGGAGGSQAPAGRSADQAQTPAFSGNYSFKVYVDPKKQNGKLGNQTSQSRDSSRGSSTNYGNAYSDRILIYEDAKEKSTQSLLVVVDPNDIRKIHYTEGGTEQAGNVAVATVKSTASSSTSSPNASATLTTSPDASNPQEPNSNIDFIAKEVINGGERIQVKLKKVATDEYGKVDSTSTSSASTDKGYITYFIDNAKSLGADPVTQKLVSSALSTNYDLYLANFNSLNKRMGELRNNPNNQGVWARIFGGAQESKFGVESQTQYVTVQSGYDYSLKFQEASNYVGFALSYAHSNGKSKKVTRANNVASNQPSGIDDIQSDGVEVAIYNSFVSDVGWYNDTIAKFSYLFSSFVLDQSPEKSKTTNYALTLSNEVGYRYVFGEKKDFYIDPQVELGFGYVNQSDFKSKLLTASGSYNNLTAIQNYLLVLRTRAGASLGKTIYGEKDRKVGLYLGAFYEYDFVDGGSNQISLGSGATTNLGSLTSNGRVILNLGSNIELNEKTRMYIDVEKSFGDKLRTHLQFNFGARYSF